MLDVPAGGSQTVRLRLTGTATGECLRAISTQRLQERIAEADEFYARITPQSLSEDQRRVHRQALAGMLWSKQFYYFDLERWLSEHKSHPLLETAAARRAEHGVVPHAQRRRHFDAGQVGIPVVRRLGSGVPHALAVAGRFRFRERAASADAAQPVLPPERADPRLRVELQRRESAGARLGDAVSLQDGARRSAAPTCASSSARSRR